MVKLVNRAYFHALRRKLYPSRLAWLALRRVLPAHWEQWGNVRVLIVFGRIERAQVALPHDVYLPWCAA